MSSHSVSQGTFYMRTFFVKFFGICCFYFKVKSFDLLNFELFNCLEFRETFTILNFIFKSLLLICSVIYIYFLYIFIFFVLIVALHTSIFKVFLNADHFPCVSYINWWTSSQGTRKMKLPLWYGLLGPFLFICNLLLMK